MRPKTLNQGAADERACWMKHLRLVRKTISSSQLVAQAIVDKLIEWGKTRSARVNAKPKGIGRK